jgi:hypothetical protein
LILSAQTLGFFLRKSHSIEPLDDGTQMEARLTSWSLSLPANKRDALRDDGQPDEIMFQALMMRHTISIMVHEVHARLDTLPAITVNHCVSLAADDMGAQPSDVHTFHATTSAHAISRMITCHQSIVSHIHFFTCVLTLSAIVHLGRWALMPPGTCDQSLREMLRLNMGALKERSRIWKAAAISHQQVASVAKDLYQMKRQGAIH